MNTLNWPFLFCTVVHYLIFIITCVRIFSLRVYAKVKHGLAEKKDAAILSTFVSQVRLFISVICTDTKPSVGGQTISKHCILLLKRQRILCVKNGYEVKNILSSFERHCYMIMSYILSFQNFVFRIFGGTSLCSFIVRQDRTLFTCPKITIDKLAANICYAF